VIASLASLAARHAAAAAPAADSLSSGIDGLVHAASEGRMSTAVEVAVLLTLLSLLPAVLVTDTSLTRLIVVLSCVRLALGASSRPIP
jgi:flagellar biosynthetic protein FliP